MRTIRRLAALSAAALLTTGVAVVIAPTGAQAHGVAMFPAARTFMCYQDGLQPNGQIISSNPACAAATAATGTTPLYNWFAVLRSDAGGRTTGFIPDGQICSGGTGGPFDFTAYNAARTDWPITHLTSGATYQFHYSNWAAHPGAFNAYITRQGWTQTTPLAWADLVPFGSATNPPATGPAGALNYYFWDQQVPTARTGPAIIFIQWVRSDSQENFFSCSDVVFDGGNGQVTGVGSGGATQPPGSTQPPVSTQPPASTPPVTTRPPTTSQPPVTSQPPTNGACSASFKVTSSWAGNFQGEITVTAGTSAVNGWTVRWTNPTGQSVSQLWNGVLTQSASAATVKNAAYNAAIPANGTTTFGFLSTNSGTPAVTGLSCSSP